MTRITSLIQGLLFFVLFAPAGSVWAQNSPLLLETARAPLLSTNPVAAGDYRRAIKASQDLDEAHRVVLENHLRLRFSASMMANGRYEKARRQLKQIQLESPSAVQAGLLIAESYRLEKQPETAKNWFIRTAQRFPYRPQTLAGLLAAAHDQAANNPEFSLALFEEVNTQSQHALKQLDSLMAAGHIDPMAILFPSTLDDQVRRALLQRCLEQADGNLIKSSAKLKSAVSSLIQIQQQHQQLERKLTTLAWQLTDYQQQKQNLEKQREDNKASLTRLEQQLKPNHFGPEQIAIRKQFTRLRNHQARLAQQADFINQTSQQLPALILTLEDQLRRLHQSSLAQLKENKELTEVIMEKSYQGLYSDLRDLSAESKLQQAELMLFLSP